MDIPDEKFIVFEAGFALVLQILHFAVPLE
jgi:hypothetical protein